MCPNTYHLLVKRSFSNLTKGFGFEDNCDLNGIARNRIIIILAGNWYYYTIQWNNDCREIRKDLFPV
jgi:hypothetical protein